jgi:hypothetical protein
MKKVKVREKSEPPLKAPRRAPELDESDGGTQLAYLGAKKKSGLKNTRPPGGMSEM